MRRTILCALLVLGAAIGLGGCGGAPVETGANEPDLGSSSGAAETPPGQRVPVGGGGSFVRVPPDGLRSLMEDEDEVVLVNTHVPFEGNLPRTDLSIPYDEIGQSLRNRLPGKNARIAVYCKSGRMSAEAAEELVALGYEDVWDLEGGMDAWRRAGLPLEGV